MKMGSGCLEIVGVSLLLLLIVGALVHYSSHSSSGDNVSTNNDSIGRPLPPSVTNDAELLIQRCGKPDKDDSTENDNPRPPIPSRLIDYKKARLRFAYLPGGDTHVGDPPPYKWKFFGVVDLKTNKAVTAGQLESVLSKRLPCFLARDGGESH